MIALGFQIARSRFVKSYGPIHHSMVFDRCKGSNDVLVKLFVAVVDPFEPDPALMDRVCLHAYLEHDGIHFGSRTQWDEGDLIGQSSLFERFGSPFFEKFKNTENLIAIVEAAQAAFKTPESYLRGAVPEPTDPAAREFLSSLPSPQHRPIPLNEDLLSLLYWHRGDVAQAVEHASRYLELIPMDMKMKARLSGMNRRIV